MKIEMPVDLLVDLCQEYFRIRGRMPESDGEVIYIIRRLISEAKEYDNEHMANQTETQHRDDEGTNRRSDRPDGDLGEGSEKEEGRKR